MSLSDHVKFFIMFRNNALHFRMIYGTLQPDQGYAGRNFRCGTAAERSRALLTSYKNLIKNCRWNSYSTVTIILYAKTKVHKTLVLSSIVKPPWHKTGIIQQWDKYVKLASICFRHRVLAPWQSLGARTWVSKVSIGSFHNNYIFTIWQYSSILSPLMV